MRRSTRSRSRPRTIIVVMLRWGILLAVLALVFWMTGCMERLFYHPISGATPPPVDFPDAEGVWFESGDGTRLYGWFLPAQAPEAGPVPTILHAHGNAGNIQSHLPFTDFLPEAGFNLFIFDYRGYGQSHGTASRRQDLIADTSAALDALLARDDVDPDSVAVYGQSLGGAIALNVMAERPELRAAVIVSAFTGWREVAASALGGRRPGPIARGLAALCIPEHSRPIDAILRIDRPILILHGDADRIVPVSHGRDLGDRGPTAVYVELPGGDHNDLPGPAVRTAMVRFLRRHLAHPPRGNEPMGEQERP